MQESGGRGLDPMQAAEGSFNTRYPHEPNGIKDPEYSIQCGVQELKADLFRNLQVVWTVQTGLSKMENGKTALMNQRQEILSSLIGKAMVQQTTLVS